MPAICVIAEMFARGDFATQANQSPKFKLNGWALIPNSITR